MKKALAACAALAALAGATCCRSAAPAPQAVQGNSSAVRRIQFSGYEWVVKSSEGRVGPGPNYFSDGGDNVTVDDRGRLHLRLTERDGRWYCAEVVSARSFGYGTYRFYLDTPAEALDPQAVLGMFTWNDDPAYNHREIDIEVSRWGRADNQNGQFVVQPYTRPTNVVRFQIPAGLRATTHLFTWRPDGVFAQSFKGHAAAPEPGSVIRQHNFTQGIPRAGGENARINLWLLAGRPPRAGEQEVVVSKFEFEELPP
ncbi:MAG TPA: glycoside hydrolase family 16 protein [Pyrinomonadaceae bacterium]|nr:glycoside hydrolase family 16 protein [Pyrinomonadaceae bacterium]